MTDSGLCLQSQSRTNTTTHCVAGFSFMGTDKDQVYGQGFEYRKTYPEAKLYYLYAGDPISSDVVLIPQYGVTSAGELIKVRYKAYRWMNKDSDTPYLREIPENK